MRAVLFGRLRLWVWVTATLLLAACGKPPVYQQESFVFGTSVQITIYGTPEADAKAATAAVLADLDRLHTRLHAWHPSDITRLNQAFAAGQSAQADPEMMGILQQAKGYAERADQLFDPAIGDLVAAWGFHNDTFAPVLPDPDKIKALVAAHPTLDDLRFDGPNVSSTNPEVNIDLGGFKGFALDRAASYLRKHHIYNALINIGGNVLALGKKGDAPWKVGLQHPRKPGAMAVITLGDGESIGTSGDYERYFEVDGKRYCHLIDPRTGWPAQTMQAATVITPASREAGAISDALTKPVFIGGIDKAVGYATRFGVKDVLIVANDGSVYLTPSMQARVEWLITPPHVYRLR
ncbi:thiamine biosynthesis lipoprotein [Silvimonas terrae]|uniref:FAD:protein FMN transferase n=1 Tax=Silvimonas terrae TaxID=300266 RepID=A0A840RJF4_9NEIS|nr:FAD:protein FMN transferase [Silvimonas terrae]MBB5192436.1 thiamine biosynthesis lipoprotein [Silvimonas terrae]